MVQHNKLVIWEKKLKTLEKEMRNLKDVFKANVVDVDYEIEKEDNEIANDLRGEKGE